MAAPTTRLASSLAAFALCCAAHAADAAAPVVLEQIASREDAAFT